MYVRSSVVVALLVSIAAGNPVAQQFEIATETYDGGVPTRDFTSASLSTGVVEGLDLLWSLGVRGDVEAPPEEPREVQFVLDLQSAKNGDQGPFALESPFVGHGESISIDFANGNPADFTGFASLLANGESDLMGFRWRWRDDACPLTCPQGGFIGEFDLDGSQVELVRLSIRDTQVVPVVGALDAYTLSFDVTYDFYGRVIPEPLTAALLLVGAAMLKGVKK